MFMIKKYMQAKVKTFNPVVNTVLSDNKFQKKVFMTFV